MAITVNTDTYISLADASTYVAANYISTDTEYTTWTALTDGNKEIYLKKATKKIDRQIIRGVKAVSTQALAFPRTIYSYAGQGIKTENTFFISGYYTQSAVPQAVKDAQVEEALCMAMGESDRRKLRREGVKSFSLGSLSESYSGKPSDLISSNAKELLKPYLAGMVPVI